MGRKIAIIGDRERHEEVLEILELLGGKKFNQIGNCDTGCYFIGENNIITLWPSLDQSIFKIFSVNDFWKTFPYKPKESVFYDGKETVVENLEWVADEEVVYYGLSNFACYVSPIDLVSVEKDEVDMAEVITEVLTERASNTEPKATLCKEPWEDSECDSVDKAFAPDLRGQDYSGKRYGYKIPNGYEFEKIEKGEIILKPISPVIPKTFEECCNVLGIVPSSLFREHHENIPLAYVSKMDNIYKLIICQHAYWKVLCNDYKPGIDSKEISAHCSIYVNPQLTLIFPYMSVMEQFEENFKDIIEKLKNL